MDWGILQGLGQGLQGVGAMYSGMKEDERRAKMAEDLENKRWERTQNAYDPKQDRPFEKSPGVWVMLQHSANGKQMGERPLTPDERDDILNGRKKTAATIEKQEFDLSEARTKSENDAKDREREERLYDGAGGDAAAIEALRISRKLAPSADTIYSVNGSLKRALESGRGEGKGGTRDSVPTSKDAVSEFKKNNGSDYSYLVDLATEKNIPAARVDLAIQEAIEQLSNLPDGLNTQKVLNYVRNMWLYEKRDQD